MDLIQLKVPPDRMVLVIDAIERDLARGTPAEEAAALRDVLVWLRYRHGRWVTRHPQAAKK